MRKILQSFLPLALATACAGGSSGSPDDPAVERDTQTGAVTTIFPTDADTRVPRVVDLLRGRVPGLEVVDLPEGGYTLRIRGQRSLSGDPRDSEPLLVIDGMPVSTGSIGVRLDAIAPRDVARIDVLKDASSAGAYGIRGANGVIIITTKRTP